MTPLTHLEVLLVEDDPSDAWLTREQLQGAWGTRIDVRVAQSLGEACAVLAETTPACVLLDLSLPDAFGLDGLARLQESTTDAAIVVLSGLADEDVALRAVQAGAQDYIVKGRLDDEGFGRAIRYAVERKRAELALAHQALHDGLTGLPNRALFVDRLGRALSRSEATGSCAVLFVDLDRFKVVNESLGLGGADQVLREVARRLREVVRPSDTVGRLGADEFVVLCEDVSDEGVAAAVAERILGCLLAPVRGAETELFVSASIGIALSGAPDATADTLIREADQATDRAKERGGSRYELADTGAHARALARMQTETALRRGLDRDEFVLHYQPIVDLGSGRTVGAEALLRWERGGGPNPGLVPPLDFIPLAEESGLILPIGAWVIEEACRQAGEWACGDRPFTISVNLSARQLSDPSLVAIVARALSESGVDPQAVVLEITESVAVEDAEDNRAAISALRSLGVKLGLDDFGTGYASLAFLKRFPLDVLKIDRSFVSGLTADSEDGAIVAAVLGLARARGLLAVAEGVETEEERDVLIALGCPRAQGYLFSRPLTPARFAEHLRIQK